jgi:hypothetical protein
MLIELEKIVYEEDLHPNIIDICGGRGGVCKPLPHADSFFRLGTFLVAGR